MQIVFMGGKNIGYGCLKFLLENKENIVGIFVNPSEGKNSPDTRWHEWVVDLALEHNLPLFRYKNINSPEALETLRNLSPDIIFAIYYDQILKEEVISIPPKGCINIHMALSEEYRGCYPTTWALINGEERTGVTIHYIDKSIDSGDIIDQQEYRIKDTDDGHSLYNNLTNIGIELFKKNFSLIKEGKQKTRKQILTERTRYHKKIFPDRKVDFKKSGKEIYNFIRALTFEPFPPPYFYIGDKRMIIVEDKKKDS